jgi:hypothetical protein
MDFQTYATDYGKLTKFSENTRKITENLKSGFPNTRGSLPEHNQTKHLKDYNNINNIFFPKTCKDFRSILFSILIKRIFLGSEFIDKNIFCSMRV